MVIVMRMMVVSSVAVTAVVAVRRCLCSICFVLVPKTVVEAEWFTAGVTGVFLGVEAPVTGGACG